MVLPDFLDFQIFKQGRMGIVITPGEFFWLIFRRAMETTDV